MLAKEYADSITVRLSAEAFRPVPERLLWLLLHALIVAGCTLVIVDARPPNIAKLALALVIGFSFTCLGILGHEILHGSVVTPLWLRRLSATICLAPLGVGPVFWTIWHNIHHAHTQHPVKDPDCWSTMDRAPQDKAMGFLRRFTRPRTPMFFFLLAAGVTGHSFALLFCLQKQMTLRQRITTVTEFVLLWLFWLGLGWWLQWTNFVFFFAIPLVVANLIVNSFVVTNHFLSPLDEESDPLATTLTVTMNRWVERLLLNFNYHVEHHLFPRMSPKYLPLVAELLKESWADRYHSWPYGKALLMVWRTPRVYYDGLHLFDPSRRALYGTLGHGLEPEASPTTSGMPADPD